jgi:hypothetical protein
VSRSPTSPDPQLRRLLDEGYDATLVGGMLVVRHVPYVAPGGGDVRLGTLAVIAYISGNVLVRPHGHMAWWVGQPPCDADGHPLKHLIAGAESRQIMPGVQADLQLCNKPKGREFHDHHEYVTTYVAIISAHAQRLDPLATARVGAPASQVCTSSPFRYADTATARAGTGAAAERIAGQTVGIVGLGGTGSYVLDLVAKCPVYAIHLFDADRFEQHNAFRCPGAFAIENLRAPIAKVELLTQVYSRLHRRVVPHPMRIDATTVPMLDLLDFVFVCVDDGAARPPILEHLASRGIPYVDVGMGLSMSDDGVVGAVRTTLGTPATHDSLSSRIPSTGDPAGLYASNVQIAELNALNAALAVLAWKRMFGFYATGRDFDHGIFVVETGAMHREGRVDRKEQA